MRLLELGSLRARVTGGTDREGAGDGPVVVLLHGFGAPGDDLVSMWRSLDVPGETRFVFPEAPLSLDFGYGDSRAWWMIDIEAMQRAMIAGRTAELIERQPAGLLAAREAVQELLNQVERKLGVRGDKIVLGGFSQGAMLALDVALADPRPLAGLVLMSGGIVNQAEWTARMSARTGLRVFQSHGVQDPILPFELAERLRDELGAAGLELTWVDFRGGHEIPWRVTEKLGEFLRGVSGGS